MTDDLLRRLRSAEALAEIYRDALISAESRLTCDGSVRLADRVDEVRQEITVVLENGRSRSERHDPERANTLLDGGTARSERSDLQADDLHAIRDRFWVHLDARGNPNGVTTYRRAWPLAPYRQVEVVRGDMFDQVVEQRDEAWNAVRLALVLNGTSNPRLDLEEEPDEQLIAQGLVWRERNLWRNWGLTKHGADTVRAVLDDQVEHNRDIAEREAASDDRRSNVAIDKAARQERGRQGYRR